MSLFKKAIVRSPSPSMIGGLTSVDLGLPDFEVAVQQHEQYVNALNNCGVDVVELPPINEHPDAVFVEDVAVCTSDFAIITNPGAPSRTEEKTFIREALEKEFELIYQIEAPGTLEGGDVLQIDKHFYVGISERTNEKGYQQFASLVTSHGYRCSSVLVKNMIHFKTGVSYLGNETLLVDQLFDNVNALAGYNKIIVPPNEAYAANCVLANNRVFIPAGFPETQALLSDRSFELIPLEMTEFQKIDGGLSCLSLRF